MGKTVIGHTLAIQFFSIGSYVVSQREGDIQDDEYVNVSTTKLHKRSEEAFYESITSDKPRYAEPTVIATTQNTGISVQENLAYKKLTPKTT